MSPHCMGTERENIVPVKQLCQSGGKQVHFSSEIEVGEISMSPHRMRTERD